MAVAALSLSLVAYDSLTTPTSRERESAEPANGPSIHLSSTKKAQSSGKPGNRRIGVRQDVVAVWAPSTRDIKRLPLPADRRLVLILLHVKNFVKNFRRGRGPTQKGDHDQEDATAHAYIDRLLLPIMAGKALVALPPSDFRSSYSTTPPLSPFPRGFPRSKRHEKKPFRPDLTPVPATNPSASLRRS